MRWISLVPIVTIMVLPSIARAILTVPKKCLFNFGFIADTQYANIADDFNFQRTVSKEFI